MWRFRRVMATHLARKVQRNQAVKCDSLAGTLGRYFKVCACASYTCTFPRGQTSPAVPRHLLTSNSLPCYQKPTIFAARNSYARILRRRQARIRGFSISGSTLLRRPFEGPVPVTRHRPLSKMSSCRSSLFLLPPPVVVYLVVKEAAPVKCKSNSGSADDAFNHTTVKQFIRNVRAAKTIADERAVIQKESAAIRASFREESHDHNIRFAMRPRFVPHPFLDLTG